MPAKLTQEKIKVTETDLMYPIASPIEEWLWFAGCHVVVSAVLLSNAGVNAQHDGLCIRTSFHDHRGEPWKSSFENGYNKHLLSNDWAKASLRKRRTPKREGEEERIGGEERLNCPAISSSILFQSQWTRLTQTIQTESWNCELKKKKEKENQMYR